MKQMSVASGKGMYCDIHILGVFFLNLSEIKLHFTRVVETIGEFPADGQICETVMREPISAQAVSKWISDIWCVRNMYTVVIGVLESGSLTSGVLG